MSDAGNYSVGDTLKNGIGVTIRSVRASDKAMIAKAFRNLERETVYARFFSYKDALSDAELSRITSMDSARDVMLVVTTGSGGDEIVIGSASYHAYELADGGCAAEVAFIVEEDFHGLGIASRLLGHLVKIASDRGIARLEAEVLAENEPMLRVFERSGLPTERRRDGDVVRLSMALPV